MDLQDVFAVGRPELLWGVLTRGIGLVLLLSFASISAQVLALAGRQGITPVGEALAASRRDFPAPQRYLYFPSLLWLCDHDRVLQWLPRLGMLCALGIVMGGPLSPYLFACAFVLYLSLDRAVTLIYPWDCLLFEATFFGILLPTTHALPLLDATMAPLPAVAWVYRLMIFRVMVGFGKHKFLGGTPQDSGFLKGFFVSQPIPTPIGLAAYRWPMAVHKLALLIMFAVELPLQFFVFFPGPLSVIGGVATVLLMVGIQLTGNFGYFNLAMAVLSLSWFDNTTAAALSLDQLWASGAPVLVHAIVVAHTTLAIISFPFNSFCAHSWMLWSPFLRVRPSLLTLPVSLVRALHPFRLVHAYGVFPPQSPPPVKLSPVTQVSWDGLHFETLAHRFFPTHPDSRPVFCAPHHDRVEQAMIYEGSGISEAFVYRNLAGRFDPYGHGGVPAPRRLLERLVNGSMPKHPFYDRHVEATRGAPSHARVRVHCLVAAGDGDRCKGRAYSATEVGPHFAPVERGSLDPRPDFPPPELWHYEDVYWLLRSNFARRYFQTPEADPCELATGDVAELRAQLDEFWERFVPGLPPALSANWEGVRAEVTRLRAEYGTLALHRMERIAARNGALLALKLLPEFVAQGFGSALGGAKPGEVAGSLYDLRVLCLHIVLQGREAFNHVWREPGCARTHASLVTPESGHLLQVLFRYEDFVHSSQKLRLLESVLKHEGRPPPSESTQATQDKLQALGDRMWGGLRFARFLRTQFAGKEDQLDIPEQWPRFRIAETGEVLPIDETTPASD